LSVLYPFVISLGPINELSLYLITTPLFFLSIIIQPINQRVKFFPENSRLFIFALFILLVWAAISFFSNPFTLDLNDHDSKMIVRAYLIIGIGILSFFSTLYYFSTEKINENKFLKFIILSSLVFGSVRVICYFVNIEIPILGGTFRYAEDVMISGTKAYRIGGLDICVILGMSALLAYSIDNINLSKIVLLLLYLFLFYFGGGRTVFLGLLISFFTYLFLFKNKYSIMYFVSFMICASFFLLATQYLPMPGQIKRIASIVGGVTELDPLRAITYEYYLDIFLKNPIFGKGIGNYQGIVYDYSDFVLEQLRAGGHCAYLSIISIFGLGGAIFLIIFLFGGLIKSYRLACYNPQNKLLAFIMIYLITVSFYFTTSGSGYNDFALYFNIGILSGLSNNLQS
jgi:hypothetical protein